MNVKAVSVAGNACLCPQIILEDSVQENILLAAGNVIQNVQISSGLLKGTYRSHQDLVSAMCTVKTANNTLIASASFDGNIKLWNPESFETSKSFQVNRPVVKMFCVPFWIEKTDDKSDVSSSSKVDYLVILARSSNPEKKSFDILKISVSDLLAGNNNFSQFGSTLTPRLDVFSFDTTLSSSNGGSSFKTYHALVANGKKGLNFLICAERENLSAQQSSVYFSLNDPVIAFATNVSSGSIAVGHDNGQLSVLTNVAEFLRQFWQLGQKRSSEVLVASHHWHAHPVMSLCFSPDGSLLYSGGEENVLVIWDLKNAGRNYLPRLGAPISRIISCQSVQRAGHVLVTTVDNAVRLINIANFEIEWLWQSANISTSINSFQPNKQPKASSTGEVKAVIVSAEQQRLQLLRSLQAYRFHEDHAERSWFAQCLINPRTGNLLINGNPGIMQEFDFYNGIIRQNHPLLQHNRVSRKDPGMRMFLPSITRFAVDASGRLLVTIDVKRGEEQPKEYSLKIWEWFPETENDYIGAGQYRIVAQLDKPHGDYPVTCLAVSQHTHSALDMATASNEQLLQSVMIATGSNDGTIKMWTRKVGDDVQDMYTSAVAVSNTTTTNNPTTGNKAANSTPTASSSSASTNANNKKQYTLHKLRWKCHYAFTYRMAPVLAATFSVDSSLLIVAHENLITCWDPQTVALRASLTLSVPRKVTFLSVIEPRAAADYGQGVGDVYLVAATNVSVTVFSLLTLQPLWSLEGGDNLEIEAIATANSESFALSGRVDAHHQHRFQSTLAEEGWIAVATSTGTQQQQQQQQHHQQHHISVFSPVSSQPILQEQVSLSSKITSLTFLRRHLSSEDSSSSSSSNGASKSVVMGLAALTADSDVWVIQPTGHVCTFQPGVTAMVGAKAAATLSSSTRSSSTSSSVNPAVAQVKTPKLPKVSFNKDASLLQTVDMAGDLSSRIVAPTKAVAPMGRALASKEWLRSLLPENTEDLPRISDIAGSYLRSMMDNSVPSSTIANINNNGDNDMDAQQTSNGVSVTAAGSMKRPAVAAMATVSQLKTTLPVEDTQELLRRVSAKWDSVLGKRPATSSSLSSVEDKEVAKTPAKKSKKNTEEVVTSTTPVAAPKSASKKTPSKSVAAAAAAAAEEEDVVTEKKKRSSSSSSSKKTVSSTASESVLPPVPEDEEVETASATAAAAATTRSSSRKRKGSDLSSVASETDDDHSQLNNNNNDNDDDAASVATDVTTPSVASARRSARQKTNSFLSLVATATAPPATDATATRSTRSRK